MKPKRPIFDDYMIPFLAIELAGGSTEVSRILGISIRRTQAFASGERKMPRARRLALAAELEARAIRMQRLAAKLKR